MRNFTTLPDELCQEVDRGYPRAFGIRTASDGKTLVLITQRRALPVLRLKLALYPSQSQPVLFNEENFVGQLALDADGAKDLRGRLAFMSPDGEILLSSDQDLLNGNIVILAGISCDKTLALKATFGLALPEPRSSLLWDMDETIVRAWELDADLMEGTAQRGGGELFGI